MKMKMDDGSSYYKPGSLLVLHHIICFWLFASTSKNKKTTFVCVCVKPVKIWMFKTVPFFSSMCLCYINGVVFVG